MEINFVSQKIGVTDDFKQFAELKLQKIEKLFDKSASAKITLSEHKGEVTVELMVASADMLFRAEQQASDKKEALLTTVDRIIRQIRKHKTKLIRHLKNDNLSLNLDDIADETTDYEVIKTKALNLRPMTVDEAILQMNMLSHDFFMFKDATTGKVSLVYKRKDENYSVMIAD